MTKHPNALLRGWSALKMVAFLAAVAWSTALQAASSQPTVTTSHGTYLAGEDIVVAYANGPGNTTDWIGLLRSDADPNGGNYVSYRYVQSDSAATGEVSFAGGLPAGSYIAYLYENDGYRILAQDAFTVIETTAPLVRADKQAYRIGEAINVAFARGPGNVTDWIGIYAEGETPGPGSYGFRYVDDAGAPRTEGTITLPNGIDVPGRMVAYLFENDTYTPIAQDTFEVTVAAVPVVDLQTDHASYLQGYPITIRFDGGPGNPRDWIGLYRLGGAAGDYVDWRYVNNSQAPTVGISSGEVTLASGAPGPGVWRAFFLVNDGYEIVGETTFTVLDPVAPIVQMSQRVYEPDAPISVYFNNASGYAKDWIAIYPSGWIPDGDPGSTLWSYTDGTTTGTPNIVEGTIDFTAGLPAGEYTAFLLENDTYTVLARETFRVEVTGPQPVRLLSTVPEHEETGTSASPTFQAVLENKDTQLNVESVRVTLTTDGNSRTLAHTTSIDDPRITITAPITEILPQNSTHTITLTYTDSASQQFTHNIQFTVGDVVHIALPAPIFLETFESTAEGSLPAGWTAAHFGDLVEIAPDLGHLGSSAYNDFTVVDSARLGGDFLSYANGTPETRPIAQILGPSRISYVQDGALLRQLPSGKILIGISGYHSGGNEILEITTPSINLSGHNDIHLSFRSLLEQNQDSIAGIEVSVDGGTTWSPVIYYLDPPDIISADGVINVEATYTTPYSGFEGVARTPEGEGGFYGYFLKAPLDASVGAATQPRINDDPADGSRIEVIRVPAADNQADVRFRLFFAGTDSWYFGVDNFGLYSISIQPEARLTVTRSGSDVTITWPAELTGYVLQSSQTLLPGSWQNVADVTGNSYTTTATGIRFYRLIATN